MGNHESRWYLVGAVFMLIGLLWGMFESAWLIVFMVGIVFGIIGYIDEGDK